MKRTALSLFTIFITISSIAQYSKPPGDYRVWDPERKLTVDDFHIKIRQQPAYTSFVQFTMDYKVTGFDFMTKNFNKRVTNAMIPSASWIDTSADVERSLRYEQTLFDLAEVYTRHFRQQLKANRKKLASGTQYAEELNAKIMADFAKRRLQYDSETLQAANESEQVRWEGRIKQELAALAEFSRE
jgi:hypothetical protein